VTTIEGILLWASMFSYFFTFILYLTGAVFKKEKLTGLGWRLFILSFILQTLTILWRWYVSGRVPVMVSYEHYQLGTWFIAVATIISGILYNPSRIIASITTPAILIMLGIGIGTPSEMIPLAPPYKSNWLFIHIGFAWFAWGCFFVATGLAVVYLFKKENRQEGWFLAKFPSRNIIDELMVKLIIFGFICQGLMIIAGAIWAHQLWGRYWGWDPIETWSLICWLVYGVVLHLRLMMGWKGRKMAIIVILALTTAIVYFWGIGFGPQSHTKLMLFENQ
jgi:cytochrome c-type biogenesis protein CcsB